MKRKCHICEENAIWVNDEDGEYYCDSCKSSHIIREWSKIEEDD